MPSVRFPGRNSSFFLHIRAVGHGFVDRQHAEVDHFAVVGPRLGRILGGVARSGKLRFDVKCYGALLKRAGSSVIR
jgi:hypothetical protein